MRFGFPELRGYYDHAIVHCAATPASMDLDASWIDRVHRQRGFFNGNGYNIFIKRDGEVQWTGTGHKCRPFGVPGAHVGGCGPGWNQRALGICMAGGVKEDGKTPEDNFTDEQYASLWAVLQEVWTAFGISEKKTMGHRDLIKLTNAAPKACPCFSVRAWMETQHKTQRSLQTTVEHELDLLDIFRAVFNWFRSERPAVPRGEKLKVTKFYTVQPGDTLWSISNAQGVRLQELRSLNNLSSDTIQPGQKLRMLN